MDDTLIEGTGGDAGAEVKISEATETPVVEKETVSQPEKAAEPQGDEGTGGDAGAPKKPSGSAVKAEQIKKLQARVAELEGRAGKPESPDKPPRFDDYPDWDAHQAALMEYAASKALQKATKATAQEELSATRQAVMAEHVHAHEIRRAEARERIEGYDKTLASYQGPALSEDVARLLLESDKSELLAFHLATRPDLARELNGLSSIAAARRIGQIEARLSYPQPKTQSNAPPPVSGIKGNAQPARQPDEMSYKEFVKFRNAGGTISLGG